MSKRRRPTHVQSAERQDVLAMAKAGYSVPAIALSLDRSEATIRGVIEAHWQEFIADAKPDEPEAETRAERYLRLHEEAAKIAAANGDAKPAMDMLDRLGLVPETSRDRTLLAIQREKNQAQTAIASAYGANRGVIAPTVNIGIGLPGQLGPSSVLVQSGTNTLQLPSETGEIGSKVHTLQGQVVQVVDKAGQ